MNPAFQQNHESPYKGLVPFTVDDAPYFFGREADQEIIAANLMASRLTLLYGASGVGKSSVLRAGVAHQLQQLAQKNLTTRRMPEHIVVVFSSWREDPLTELLSHTRTTIAQTWHRNLPEPEPAIRRSLASILRLWTEGMESDLIIILDQFEEYFLYHPREEGPGTFAFEFPLAVNHPFLRASFLISIREDALAKLDRFKGRIPGLFENYLRIDHLDLEAARAAIEKPVARYNQLHPKASEQVIIEPALVEAVLEQVKTGQVALSETGRGVIANGIHPVSGARIETPYLQLVMTRLWETEMQAGSRQLQLETLKRLGGAERIVRTHLDTAMSSLAPRETEAAARIFHYLVTPSGTKIAHTVSDLAEMAKLPQAHLLPVLYQLSGSGLRILRSVAPPPDRPEAVCYEIFHDVLAPAVLNWRSRYVQAQDRAEAERRAEEQRQRAEEKARIASRLRKLALALSIVSALAVTAAVFAWLQWRQANVSQRSAEMERNLAVQHARMADSLRLAQLAALDTAEVRRLQAEQAKQQSGLLRAKELAAEANRELTIDPQLSLLLSLHAAAMTYPHDGTVTSETQDALNRAVQESRLRRTLSGHTNWVRGVAFSPDGTRLASASMDGKTQIWDVTSGRTVRTLSGLATAIYGVAFSPDGKSLATANLDGSVALYDVTSGQVTRKLSGHTMAVHGVAFSPDGKRLASVSGDAKAKIWDIASGQSIFTLSGHTAAIYSVAYSPNGRRLATADEGGETKLWDLSTGRELRTLSGHTSTVYGVAFSPAGTYLATAGADWNVKLWNADSGGEVRTFSGHNASVNGVAFSPDGRLLATAGGENKVKIWDVASGRELFTLIGHTAAVMSVAFSAEGKSLATASADKTVKLWGITGEEVFILVGHTGATNDVVFSPDGRRFVTVGADGTGKVWDATSGRFLVTLSGHAEAINRVAIRNDGAYVATASNDNTARLWEPESGKEVARFAHEGDVIAVAFSPDGKLLTTAGGFDKTIKVWDVASTHLLVTLTDHSQSLTDVAFSPHATRLATASLDGTVKVWNVSPGRQLLTLSRQSAGVNALAFSPDGTRLATATDNGTVKLWAVASGQALLTFTGHDAAINDLEFSPDATSLATASSDGTIKLWATASGRELLTLTGHTAAITGLDFSPDGKRLATASADQTVRVYALNPTDLIALARARVTRALTPEECRKYLHVRNCPPLPF